jgi:hypothetical protein
MNCSRFPPPPLVDQLLLSGLCPPAVLHGNARNRNRSHGPVLDERHLARWHARFRLVHAERRDVPPTLEARRGDVRPDVDGRVHGSTPRSVSSGEPSRSCCPQVHAVPPTRRDRSPACPAGSCGIHRPMFARASRNHEKRSGRRNVDLDYYRRGVGRLAWCLQRLWIPLALDGLRRDSLQQTEAGPRGPAREDPLGLAGT